MNLASLPFQVRLKYAPYRTYIPLGISTYENGNEYQMNITVDDTNYSVTTFYDKNGYTEIVNILNK